MLPTLLKELKKRDYRIVQVVPNGAKQPKALQWPRSAKGNKAGHGSQQSHQRIDQMGSGGI
jgi:hypothetical protein